MYQEMKIDIKDLREKWLTKKEKLLETEDSSDLLVRLFHNFYRHFFIISFHYLSCLRDINVYVCV